MAFLGQNTMEVKFPPHHLISVEEYPRDRLLIFILLRQSPSLGQEVCEIRSSVPLTPPRYFVVFFVLSLTFWYHKRHRAHLRATLKFKKQPFLQGALLPFFGKWY